MSDRPTATACVLIIGNEVLSGRTQDQNLQFLARALNESGVRVLEARVIPDVAAVIAGTVNDARARFTYVFTTGGIGPTHDDITSASIAQAFGVPVIRHPGAEAALRAHYRPDEVNEARLKMADVPEGAQLIDNPVSRAPGFRIGNVFVLPGVPSIMRAMFDGLRHRLSGGAPMLSRTVSGFTTEGTIAAPLADIQQAHADVEIGSYPFVRYGRFGVSLVIRGTAQDAVDKAAAEICRLLSETGVEAIEDDPITG
jgi:molybdenum cofactor synthesis domain-containing protein